MDTYTVAKPFHKVSKVLGLTSFTITSNKGKFVVSTNVFDIFCILSSTLCCIGGSFYFHDFMFSAREWFAKYDISSTVEKSSLVLTIFYVHSMICVNWWIFCSRHVFAKIFNALSEVDEKLKAMSAADNSAKHRRIVVFILFLATIPVMYHIAVSLAMVLIMDNRWVATIVFAMWIYMTSISYAVFQFAFFMWQVKIRYQRINLYVANLQYAISFGQARVYDPLKVAAKVHDKLVDISQMINRCYGFPVSY